MAYFLPKERSVAAILGMPTDNVATTRFAMFGVCLVFGCDSAGSDLLSNKGTLSTKSQTDSNGKASIAFERGTSCLCILSLEREVSNTEG